ncbi:MAG: CTAG/PCC1 family protein [Candidatus Diapherotrites archaeon]
MNERIKFELQDERLAKIINCALKPELNALHEKNCRTGISVKNSRLELSFSALNGKALENSKKHYMEMVQFCRKMGKEV